MGVKYHALSSDDNCSREVDEDDSSHAWEINKDDKPGNKVVLPRFLGLVSSLSFTFGLIVGTGIFLTPAGVLRGSGGSIGISLIVWVVGAFVSATGAMCLTELTLYFRQSGGAYVFLSSIYGPLMGFLKVWITFFVLSPCSTAIQSLTIVNFLITPFVGICGSVPDVGIKLGATCVFLLAVFVNSVSTRWTVKFQVFFSLVKISALLAVILMGDLKLFLSGTGNFEKLFQTSGEFDITKLPSAFFSAYFAYGGWENISYITEEVKKPAETIVHAMTISFICVTILYLLANIAYITVLTPEEIMSSDAVAALFAVRIIGKWSFIIWLCVVFSAAGNLSGSTYTRSRIFFVAARSGQFPFILSTIHIRRKTPLPAIIVAVPFTLLVIWSGNIWSIINFLVCFNQIVHLLIAAIVPYLRWKQPDQELSYKAPFWSYTIYIGFTTVLLLMTSYTNPLQIFITAAVICIALVFYGLTQLASWSDKSQAKFSTLTSYMVFLSSEYINDYLQKIFLSVEQELKTY